MTILELIGFTALLLLGVLLIAITAICAVASKWNEDYAWLIPLGLTGVVLYYAIHLSPFHIVFSGV